VEDAARAMQERALRYEIEKSREVRLRTLVRLDYDQVIAALRTRAREK
jgi:hypothetical protein